MSWLHNRVLLPLLEPERHKGLGRRLRAIRAFESLSPDQQAVEQQQRVRALLSHAYITSPYYRAMFDELGFRACDWKRGTPLPLPELTRDLLRAQGENIRSRGFAPDGIQHAQSGGTTSTPVSMWRDLEGLRDRTALQFHLNRQAGYDQGDPVLHIWGAVRDIELRPSWKWRLYEQGLLRRSVRSAAQLSTEVMVGYLKELNRRRPKIVYGYAATTARFAEYLQAAGVPFHKPRRLIVTAEPLSMQDRKLLEDTFECPVTEHYGSRDIGMVAAQCEAGGRFHFHPWSCMVELLPLAEVENGLISRLVVTELLNYGMPLIRYDTGDCVLHDNSRCPCGSTFPSVQAILGRAVDNFLLPDGSLVTGMAISVGTAQSSLRFTSVRQVQLIQKATDHIHLRYSAQGDAGMVEAELAGYRQEVDRLLGVRMRWTSERVEEIERERSGKFRLTISEVSQVGSRQTMGRSG